jgi:hypothetical protein
MNKIFFAIAMAAITAMTATIASVEKANAFVCARGIYRAGCVGPRGAVGVRRGFYGGGAVVVRRPYGYGARVYRRY